MLYLKALNLDDAAEEYAFFRLMPSENGFQALPDREHITFDAFVQGFLPRRIAASQGLGLPVGHVPDTYYFLWCDRRIVGLYKLRPMLNDVLRAGAGHIGYGILPEERRKGYGTKGLALAIEQLISLPAFTDEEVYLSCSRGNPASLKVMLNNGGYIHHTDDEEHYVRIPVRKELP